MLAKDMKPGRRYRIDGQVVVFSRIGLTGFYIVHPPGEPDMQSSWAIPEWREVEEIPSDRESAQG